MSVCRHFSLNGSLEAVGRFADAQGDWAGPAASLSFATGAGVFAVRGTDITVYHGQDADEPMAGARGVAETERALVDRGVEPDAIETVIEETDEPVAAIARRAADHDVVVMGETNPSVTTVVFGMLADRVAERF
jgi:hypothetical protein